MATSDPTADAQAPEPPFDFQAVQIAAYLEASQLTEPYSVHTLAGTQSGEVGDYVVRAPGDEDMSNWWVVPADDFDEMYESLGSVSDQPEGRAVMTQTGAVGIVVTPQAEHVEMTWQDPYAEQRVDQLAADLAQAEAQLAAQAGPEEEDTEEEAPAEAPTAEPTATKTAAKKTASKTASSDASSS